jgi:hypothetical protein
VTAPDAEAAPGAIREPGAARRVTSRGSGISASGRIEADRAVDEA